MQISISTESPNLDLLRSFAVLAVLADHSLLMFADAKPWLTLAAVSIGNSGVLLFFVHTALVLMVSLQRRGSTVRQFYIQRLFRIYPLALVTVAACVAFRVPADLLHCFREPFQFHGWGWLVSNILLIQNVTGAPSVISSLWSLPLEVQMYLLLPFVYEFATSRRPIPKLLGFASLAMALAMAHFSVMWPIPCFLSGVLAFVLWRSRRMLPAVLLPVAIFGFVVINFLGYAFFHGFNFGIAWIICAAFGFLLPRFGELKGRTVRIIFHQIAKYSYGVYLSHIPLLWLCLRVIPGIPQAVRWSLFASLVVLIPVLLYQLIERPMIGYGRRISERITIPAGPDARPRVCRVTPVPVT